MKMLNATWMPAMSQPFVFCIGITNSVQAYCRLAISTMHSTPSQSWTHRLAELSVLADMRTSRTPAPIITPCVNATVARSDMASGAEIAIWKASGLLEVDSLDHRQALEVTAQAVQS